MATQNLSLNNWLGSSRNLMYYNTRFKPTTHGLYLIYFEVFFNYCLELANKNKSVHSIIIVQELTKENDLAPIWLAKQINDHASSQSLQHL